MEPLLHSQNKSHFVTYFLNVWLQLVYSILMRISSPILRDICFQFSCGVFWSQNMLENSSSPSPERSFTINYSFSLSTFLTVTKYIQAIYLWGPEREKQRQSIPIHWVTPRMPTTARAAPGHSRSWELEAGLPCGWQQPGYLSFHHCLSGPALAGN